MARSHALAAASLALLTLSAVAQSQPTQGAPMPMPTVEMSHDCGKPMKRHDHGAERGTPSPKSMPAPCAAGAAAPSAEGASAPKKRLNHDHGKFHKNG